MDHVDCWVRLVSIVKPSNCQEASRPTGCCGLIQWCVLESLSQGSVGDGGTPRGGDVAFSIWEEVGALRACLVASSELSIPPSR